jgi:hypothetical protein
MSAIDLDLSAIEHLDFDAAIPCEHSQHDALHADQPAMFLVAVWCSACPLAKRYSLCASGWKGLADGQLQCIACGYFEARDECMSILRVIGGAS